MDVSGPFLTEPVLDRVFSTGFDSFEASRRKELRETYDEWRESIHENDQDAEKIHRAWVEYVLSQALEYDLDGRKENLKDSEEILQKYSHQVLVQEVDIVTDYVLIDHNDTERPFLIVMVYDAATDLMASGEKDKWSATPAERMVELCRAKGIRVGLVTNGECWMLVDAPMNGVTTFASWYAGIWRQEETYLQAFMDLLGIRRFFGDPNEKLPVLLDESLKYQDEVTDALEEQ